MRKSYGTEPDEPDESNGDSSERKSPSADELQERYDSWREERRNQREAKRAARTQAQRQATTRRVICGALVLGLIGVSSYASMAGSSHTSAMAELKSEASQLRQSIKAQAEEAESTAEDFTSASMADLAQRAGTAAKSVAGAQNVFGQLSWDAEHEDGPQDGSPSESMTALVEHRRDLAQYWAEGSFLVDDETAYSFTTAPVLEVDEIDPRYPWYVRYDGLSVSDPKTYSWSVLSAMPSIEEPGSAQVIWLCQDDQGRTLAWASARYDGATDEFTALELSVTSEGAKHRPDSANSTTVPEQNDEKESDG